MDLGLIIFSSKIDEVRLVAGARGAEGVEPAEADDEARGKWDEANVSRYS